MFDLPQPVFFDHPFKFDLKPFVLDFERADPVNVFSPTLKLFVQTVKMVLKFGFLPFEFFVFALKLIFQISDAGFELGYFLFGVFVVPP
jgi:hypothetical protein